MRTITIANQKGGCGKTTVAINLAASIAKEARRVLLVDLDPQGHCAVGMAVPEEQIDLSILDCMIGRMEDRPIELSRITWQIAPNLDLAPSKADLSGLESRLGTRPDADTALLGLLQANADRYDYCVVDCPPNLGLLMKNGLRAANVVVIPVDTGFFSLHGLTRQVATIEQISERNGVKPVMRILPNQYDVRTKLAREILAELRDRFKGLMFETIVNFNTKLKEGASFGQPITEFDPASMGARDFEKLARELIADEPSRIHTPDVLAQMDRLAADAERLLATTSTLIESRRTPAGGSAAGDAPLESVTARVNPANFAKRNTPRQYSASEVVDRPTKPSQPSVQRTKPSNQRPDWAGGLELRTSGKVYNPTMASLPQQAAGHDGIDRKIEAIYGVRQESDLVIFRNHRPEASEIQIAGDFNDWMPHTTPMRRLPDGDFEARLKLPRGRYRYRLVVDGRWSHDLFNPAIETNEYGELNSVVEIKQ